MVSLEEGQVPLAIVQTTVLVPTDNPAIPEAGSVGVVTMAPPAKTVQVPVPTVGVLPARVAVLLQVF